MANLHIRKATLTDLGKIAEIESTCFPTAEAATKDSLQDRLTNYSKGFFVATVNDEIIGFINGACTNGPTIEDKYFESMTYHEDSGQNLMVFGLDVLPDYQRNGYAAELMKHFIQFAKTENKAAVLLTCKEHLVPYYEKFGYVSQGVSASTHGGAKWYDMKLSLI